jgi:hypothetical protein
MSNSELNAVWNKLLPAFKAEALPNDAFGQEKLKQRIADLVAHAAKKGGKRQLRFSSDDN